MKIQSRAWRCAALMLAVMLLLTSCGREKTDATTMHLRRTEGSVSVSDSSGKNILPIKDLGLYSGYEVGTDEASYAWIDLDNVKLTKLDQSSEIAIQKKGKALDIELKSGSLFFNVTQPLEDDETMTIRASTMIVGVRGTCGWVEVPDADHMNVCLLEGKVECTVAGASDTVVAGEVGRLDREAETVTLTFIAQDNIPAFVREELDGIPLDAIPETAAPEYYFKDRAGNEMAVSERAFATRIVEFIPGDPWTKQVTHMEPDHALGIPDGSSNSYGIISLGSGGVLVLEFSVAIYDGEGLDIYIFEDGTALESILVEVSNDLITWYEAGVAKGNIVGLDLNGKVPDGGRFRYVRLTDLGSDPNSRWPGADIDAVCGINIRAIGSD